MGDRVFVIGAGVGGLTTAALLARDGHAVSVFEKAGRVGGRTASTTFRNHILDNGFHIMPFYKKSAVFEVLKKLGIESDVRLAKVDRIAFYSGAAFHRYPRGIADLLRLSMIPFASRLALLRILLPMAFASMEKAEEWDGRALDEITQNLDPSAGAFFDAVCMLAFADTADHVSLGEFARTMIRANPFRGGTSEFAYPGDGGYDAISKALARYVVANGGEVRLGSPVRSVRVSGSRVEGIVLEDGGFLPSRCVVVSLPAYQAVNRLFGEGTFDGGFVDRINGLDRTTAVVEAHFALDRRIDTRQVVFPVGDYAAKGIFFISNIAPSVSPPGEHLMMSGTPVSAADAADPARIREITERMKDEISSIYPGFREALLWDRPMAWSLVESVAKGPGLVWKSKAPHEAPGVRGLYFVGDSTVSYGIGTDSAAHSSLLCLPKIGAFLGG